MRLHRIVGGLVCALLWASATAAPIPFSFEVNWTGGPLDGQTDIGHFIIDGNDCPTFATCMGTFSPDNPLATLLAFTIEVNGVLFMAASDTGGPGLPSVSLNGLIVDGIDFLGVVDGFQLALLLTPAMPFGLANFSSLFPGGPTPSVGIIGAITFIDEPATLALVGMALFMAPWLRRRGEERSPG